MNVRPYEAHGGVDSPAAWLRLVVAMAISTIGGVGMWSIMVALPTVQAGFGVSRAGASLTMRVKLAPFTDFTMNGTMDSTGRRVNGNLQGSGFTGESFTMTKQ